MIGIGFHGCNKKDFDAILDKQKISQDKLNDHEARIKAMEKASEDFNKSLVALKSIAEALQENITVVSHTKTSTGYTLTMSNGSTINILNGKDGKDGKDGTDGKNGTDGQDGNNGTDGQNGKDGKDGKDGIAAPKIGMKLDTDGRYYWTLGDTFILLAGNKMPVNGKDGQNGTDGSDGNNGTNGSNATVPQFRIDQVTGYWQMSIDQGQTWSNVLDSNNNPVIAMGNTGNPGSAGPAGPQGPQGNTGADGIPGFTITAVNGMIIITYQGITYQMPMATWQIAPGRDHTLFLSPDGKLYVTGNNAYGQTGLSQSVNVPTYLSSGVRAIVSGAIHSLFMKNDGSVWGMGYNYNGELGISNPNINMPVLIFSNAKAIFAGNSNSFIIDKNNTLWGTGGNPFGNLGNGTSTGTSTFIQIMTDVASVSPTYAFTLVVKTNGDLYGMGNNQNYQLGLPNLVNYLTPTFITSQVKQASAGYTGYSAILKTDGTVWSTGRNANGEFGTNNTSPKTVFEQIQSDVKQIQAGPSYLLLLKTNGQVLASGDNDQAVFGDGTTQDSHVFKVIMDEVRILAPSMTNTWVIKNDNIIWATGRNQLGQLGIGTNSNILTFMKITTLPN